MRSHLPEVENAVCNGLYRRGECEPDEIVLQRKNEASFRARLRAVRRDLCNPFMLTTP
jgi:hypothetical protein